MKIPPETAICAALLMAFILFVCYANRKEQNTDHLYNAYSPLYRDMYVVKTDSLLTPTSWYFDLLVQDTVIIISEYKPQ